MTVEAPKWRLSVERYHQMIDAGILGEDDRVELIEGEIFQMPAMGYDHANGVRRLYELFSQLLAGKAVLSPQCPVQLSGYSEPEPDLALVRRATDRYATRHPGPEDILLLIEVSDTILRYDREVKMPLCARNGVAEAWIVDLKGQAVEVYRDPGPEGYRQVTRLTRGQAIAPLAFPDLSIRVDEILG